MFTAASCTSRVLVTVALLGLVHCASSTTSSPQAQGGPGGSGGQGGSTTVTDGTPPSQSCDGFTSDVTSYTDKDTTIDHFPAVIEGSLDVAADFTEFKIVTSETSDISLKVTMPVDGGGASLGSVSLASTSYDTPNNTVTYELPQSILTAGTHALHVFSGKTGTGRFKVEIKSWNARARKCDPAYTDPAAARDALHSPECDALFKAYPDMCFGLTPVVDESTRARYCTVKGAACPRAAREVLACLTEKGKCVEDGIFIPTSPECTVPQDACP